MYIYIYIYKYILLFWWRSFISCSNLDKVFTYNNIYMALISFRTVSHVKEC